jgi:hypothetical protein
MQRDVPYTLPSRFPPDFLSDDPRSRRLLTRVSELLRTRAAGSLSTSVRSRIAQEFDPSDQDEIELILMQYGNDQPEAERVHTAILILAHGRKAEVAYHVAVALRDYCDVLYSANYAVPD